MKIDRDLRLRFFRFLREEIGCPARVVVAGPEIFLKGFGVPIGWTLPLPIEQTPVNDNKAKP